MTLLPIPGRVCHGCAGVVPETWPWGHCWACMDRRPELRVRLVSRERVGELFAEERSVGTLRGQYVGGNDE